MSADKAKEEGGGEASAPKGPSKIPLLLALVNTVVVLAAVGALVYTKLLFRRPAITEESERARLEAIHASPKPPAIPGQVAFEPMTINIASNPTVPKPANGTAQQIEGKMHYAHLAMVLEIADSSRKQEVEDLRQQIIDALLSIIGRKQFHELTTAQGRYLLSGQIVDVVNALVTKAAGPEAERENLVTKVYFTQFLVQ